MAMGQDDLVPPWMGCVSERTGTPVHAIASTSLFMAAIILMPLDVFVKVASTMMILSFTFELIALVLMRESRIPTYRPTWRAPLYPWMQIFGILCYGFLLVELGSLALAVAGTILGGAVAWYVLYAKVHVLRESALIRLAGRLARADFGEHDLEAELSRIARAHEAAAEDRFDRLIQDCPVLDLPRATSREELFRVVAINLSPLLNMTPEDVAGSLERRETLSSTVIRPGLAIPHLILEGIEGFHILLVRSREGIALTGGEPPVHMAIITACSPAERNFYLKALVAIAEIAQEPDFDQKWMEATTLSALREVVLAAERRREHMPGKTTDGRPGS
jgi:mannitol/fructose-specific phosphotransferase system IIA component (Ntr-type)